MEGVNPNANWKVNKYERVSACDKPIGGDKDVAR